MGGKDRGREYRARAGFDLPGRRSHLLQYGARWKAPHPRAAAWALTRSASLISALSEMVRRSIQHLRTVKADSFDCLLVDYVERRSAQAIVRGLRAVSDFEFEFQLALMNRKLNERVETIFMMPKDAYTFLSSRMIKEIAQLGGDVSAFVPPHVQTALIGKFKLASV
jgi:pantetheine-phosphate adenylyltransferase